MAIAPFLRDLDTSVFTIPSATTPGDKRSLLCLQKLVSSSVENFVYLEIGSDRGGSLAPLLADDNCSTLISIDLRPKQQADERGVDFPYPVDGEEAMMANLSTQFNPIQLERMRTFRTDICDVDALTLPKVDLALIDGEHTNVACFSDSNRMLDFVKGDAVIAFHDANLVADAIQNFEIMLTRLGINFTTVLLPDVVGAIGFGKFAETLRTELGGLSFSRKQYFAASQRQRWIAVGQSMQEQGLLPKPDVDAEHKIAQLMVENQSLKERSFELEDDIGSIRNELAATRAQVTGILASTSWKVTAPLRYFGKLIGRWSPN